MPTLLVSEADLTLLRKCFRAAAPELSGLQDGVDFPLSAETVGAAAAALTSAQPDEPMQLADVAWEALAACAEVGADMAPEVTEDEYYHLLALLRVQSVAFAPPGVEPLGWRQEGVPAAVPLL